MLIIESLRYKSARSFRVRISSGGLGRRAIPGILHLSPFIRPRWIRPFSLIDLIFSADDGIPAANAALAQTCALLSTFSNSAATM
jgi:hypothetical protein